ncbi:MAG: dihydroorotase [Erysipelotrichia bacterium]|nr:dihydroorotase [Erysipelotrichia bacterium]
MKTILKNGRVIDPANNVDDYLDVLVVNEKIAKIEKNISDEDAIIEDCSGKLVTPGFVEMHAHMRDFNEPERETFYTGSCSALCGGYTTVGVMPNSNPVIDTVEMVEKFKQRAKESSVVRLYPFASVTMGRAGKEIVDMKALKQAGVVAFSDDGNAVKEATMMRDILKATKEVDLVVDLHCEDKAYTGKGVVNAGKLSEEMGLPGISSVAEDIEIARDLIIQEEIQGHIHIAHLGSERSIKLVEFFRNRNVDFTCEVIPHQFSRTEEIVKRKGVLAKVKPPFRDEHDMLGIREGIRKHLIDVIATDHCPYAESELQGGLTATNLFGLAGFETTLPLALDLVREGYADYSYIIACLTCNPARIMRLNDRGTLSIGKDADITVIDPHIEWTVDLNRFKSKGKNNPYEGEKMRGKAVMTMINGKIVCRDWQILKQVEKPF